MDKGEFKHMIAGMIIMAEVERPSMPSFELPKSIKDSITPYVRYNIGFNKENL